jgi:hypothetical protein
LRQQARRRRRQGAGVVLQRGQAAPRQRRGLRRVRVAGGLTKQWHGGRPQRRQLTARLHRHRRVLVAQPFDEGRDALGGRLGRAALPEVLQQAGADSGDADPLEQHLVLLRGRAVGRAGLWAGPDEAGGEQGCHDHSTHGAISRALFFRLHPS